MSVLLFAGQGSQFPGMGETLFSKYSEIVQKCSQILGVSLEEVCLKKPNSYLKHTQYAQPAIYLVNALYYLEWKKQNPRDEVLMALGHSLGEYSALFASGVFSLLDGFHLVKKRGEIMEKAQGGRMLAILGAMPDEVEEILKQHPSVEVANYNSPKQIVVSGKIEAIANIHKEFDSRNIKSIPLNVSGAFHSSEMQRAQEEFSEYLQHFVFNPLKFPVIANKTAKPYQQELAKVILAQQLSKPVRWVESIQYVLKNGLQDFQEMGSNILIKMVDDIRKTYLNRTLLTTDKVSQPKENHTTHYRNRSLGSELFREVVGVKYNIVTGSMYRGIASQEMVIKMCKAGFLSFFGAGGLTLEEVEKNLIAIRNSVGFQGIFGVNFLYDYRKVEQQWELVDLLLKYRIEFIEASAFTNITPALALYAIKGLYQDSGKVKNRHKIFAKVSRPETISMFLQPISPKILDVLLKDGKITENEKQLAQNFPLSQFICVESDSGGHTDHGIFSILFSSLKREKEKILATFPNYPPIFLGAAGGIGDPNALLMAFLAGVDYVQTGSINQCTVESGTSDLVKDLLQEMNIKDTTYAPAGDMFEVGAKVQVLKKGVLFPVRANKLFQIYSVFNAIEEIPASLRKSLEENLYRNDLQTILEETIDYFTLKGRPEEKQMAMKSKKHALALVCRWYFGSSTHWAKSGLQDRQADFQIHVGPALGACNQFLKNTEFADWKKRHVDELNLFLHDEACRLKIQSL